MELIHFRDLPHAGAIPLAAVLETRSRIILKEWDFDFVYYTESDQILLLKPSMVVRPVVYICACVYACVVRQSLLIFKFLKYHYFTCCVLQREIFGFLEQYPRRALIPHRLIPYPGEVSLLMPRDTSPPPRFSSPRPRFADLRCAFAQRGAHVPLALGFVGPVDAVELLSAAPELRLQGGMGAIA